MKASNEHIPFDVAARMAISASLYALVAKHGIDQITVMVDELKRNVEQGQFSPRAGAI